MKKNSSKSSRMFCYFRQAQYRHYAKMEAWNYPDQALLMQQLLCRRGLCRKKCGYRRFKPKCNGGRSKCQRAAPPVNLNFFLNWNYLPLPLLKKAFRVVNAGVVKLVDTLDLGSSAARLGGSSPSARTEAVNQHVTMEVRRAVIPPKCKVPSFCKHFASLVLSFCLLRHINGGINCHPDW